MFSSRPDEEDESIVGDVLFNSIYISIPINRDPRELTNAIDIELGDAVRSRLQATSRRTRPLCPAATTALTLTWSAKGETADLVAAQVLGAQEARRPDKERLLPP